MLDLTEPQMARLLVLGEGCAAFYRGAGLVASLLIFASPMVAQAETAESGIIINEIHFNPGKLTGDSLREKQEEEFIELYNPGASDVQLEGWQFSRGVDYTFSSIAIPAGEFLVIAADLEAFRQNHPAVVNVVGPYSGQLSNTSEDIELEDAEGKRIAYVEYADSGHWAKRRTTRLASYDHWEWDAPNDGAGMSLELTHPSAHMGSGQAWAPSKVAGGSPGMINSVFLESNAGPWIGKVTHSPAIPRSSQAITISAKIHGKVETARVLYRPDGFSSPFLAADLQLTDSENHLWTGEIPPHSDASIVEYLIEATSAAGSVQRWPDLLQADGKELTVSIVSPRQALCLFQVDDGFDHSPIVNGDASPAYKIIMPGREIALMRAIAGRSSNNSIFNNRFNGTFISVDPAGTRIRHLCSMRMRGNGSRSAFPPGIRVSFPADDQWKGVQNINLNSQHTHSQVLGAAIHQVMGFPAARATAVTLTMSGEDWTRSTLPQFGHYSCNEVLDGDYIDTHFPTESIGNLYRGVGQANLNDRGDKASNYRTYYRKRNNGSKDDYSDVIRLCKVLDRENDTTVSDAQFLAEVKQIVDVDQWMRYFALDTLLCNLEGGFPSGRGDDYAMFRGGDGRFRLVPYDLDSILGRGQPGEELTKSIFDYGNTRGLRRLFKHPEVVRTYFGHIRNFIETNYRPEVLNRIIDDVLGGWVPRPEIEEIKAFIPRRIAAVQSQIDGYTVAGTTLENVGGVHRTNTPEFLLYGRFDPAEVVEVLVNGRRPSQLNLRSGTWLMQSTANEPIVSPGITPVIVELRGAEGQLADNVTLQIWYDTGTMTEVTGQLSTGVTKWDAASGPYQVKGELVVPTGAELQILEGTTVFFEDGAALKIAGALAAEGTATHPVRFAVPVDGKENASWNGILLEPESEPCVLTHLVVDGANHPDGIVRAQGTSLTLEDVTFGRTKSQVIVAKDVELVVQRCKFSGAGGFVSAVGGSLAVTECEFGTVTGEWGIDVIDQKAESFVSIRGNRFAAGGSLGTIQLGHSALVLENLFGVGHSSAAASIALQPGIDAIVAGNGFLGWRQVMSIGNGGNGWFEKNICRFCAETVLAGEVTGFRSSNNVIVPIGTAGPFLQPDSAWITRGQPADWDLLEVEQSSKTSSGLLTIDGIPLGGKSSPGTREITFRYPGASSFRVTGNGNVSQPPQSAKDFMATFSSNGSEPLSLDVTLLSGDILHFPEIAKWETAEGHADIVISEIVSVDSDAVELYNHGAEAIDLTGYRLTDDRKKPDKFVFAGGATLAAGSYLGVKLGKDVGLALAAEGEELLLLKPESASSLAPVDSVRFGSQLKGYSIGRIGDRWQLCRPTMGAENTAAAVALPRMVRLAEWLAAEGGAADGDFVELKNLAPIPADISGCGLTDQISTAPFRHRFPPLSFLPAEGVHVYSAGKSKSSGDHLKFKLSDDGEVLGFLDPDGLTIDWAVFQPQAAGRSQGRDSSGNLVTFLLPTPGTLPGTEQVDQAASLAKALRISEIHYNPQNESDAEFLEIANIGELPLDLGGIRISGGIDFLFQEGATLDPNQRAVVVRDRKAFKSTYGESVVPLGEYSGKLSNGGEKLRLQSADRINLQQFEYSDKWHTATDGRGPSLELANPVAGSQDWSKRAAWKPSATDGGTPGR